MFTDLCMSRKRNINLNTRIPETEYNVDNISYSTKNAKCT